MTAPARLDEPTDTTTAVARRSLPPFPFSASPIIPDEPHRPGWTWQRLTDIARLATGHTPSRRHAEYWGGDIPWLQLPDIRALDGRVVNNTSEHTNAAGIQNSSSVILPANTVCLSRTASVGFVTLMGRPMSTSQDFVNWVCGPKLNPQFLMQLLIASRKAIRALGSGAVHHTIYFPTVKAFSVALPPLAEQERIAAWLSAGMAEVEQARQAAQARLAAADALPAAIIADGLRMSEDYAGAQSVTLGEVCRIESPLVDPKLPQFRDLPHVNGENIESGSGRLLQVNSAAHDRMESSKFLFEPGVVLYSKLRPYLRKVAIADFRGLCSADMYPIACDPSRITQHFLHFVLLSEQFSAYAIEASARARMPKLNREQLFPYRFKMPSLSDQREITGHLVERLAAADVIRQQVVYEVRQIDGIPASLLRQAFGQSESGDNASD